MTLLTPVGLGLAALAAPLVALYFLRVRRKRVVVPSLLLWQAMATQDQRASPFDRFRRNLLLLLQLLVLAALVFAVARPAIETEASPYRSLVLVVDTSASMASTDGRADQNDSTRLEVAVALAEDALKGLGPSDEAMVLTAGARTEVVAPFGRDRAALTAVLATLQPTDAEGTLGDGLQLALSLARSRPDVEIVVLSDGGNEDLTSLTPGDAVIRYVPVGTRSTNAGLLALDLRRSPVNELDRQLFVTAGAFGADVLEASVELYLDDVLLDTRQVSLEPGTPRSLVFPLDGGRTGLLRVQLDAPGDLLPTDDEAFALLGDVSARSVVIVGGDALTARVLQADPRVQLTRIGPADATLDRLRDADAVLFFAGQLPAGLDGANVGLMKPSVAGPAELGETRPLPRILSWERSHPVNRFVDYQGATVARSASVGAYGGLVPVLTSDAGPLMLAGERNGGRVLQLAFDPFESDLPLRVAWPVLVLNTVGWLTERSGGSGEAALVPAGTPFVRPLPDAPDTATVVSPTGTRRIRIDDDVLRVGETDRIGLYRITVGGADHSFAANLLSERESKIQPLTELTFDRQAPITASAGVRTGRHELWRPLLGLALFLLLLESLAYHRRKTA